MTDEIIDQIIGRYEKKEIDETTGFGNEFFLDLDRNENEKLRFTFTMTTVGKFGRMGETWEGSGIFRGDHFALIIEKQNTWVENPQGVRVDNETETKETLPIELYPHFGVVAVFHKKINRIVTLDKING